jgi:hypothetical protein
LRAGNLRAAIPPSARLGAGWLRIFLVQFQKDFSHRLLVNRPRPLGRHRLGRLLVDGLEIFLADDESHRADFEAVALVKLDLTLDSLRIDEGAVRAVAIANHELIIFG